MQKRLCSSRASRAIMWTVIVAAASGVPSEQAAAETPTVKTAPVRPAVPVYRPSVGAPHNSLPIPENGVNDPPQQRPVQTKPETVFDRCARIPGVEGGANRPLACRNVRR